VSARWVWLPANPTGGTGGGAYSKLFRNDALPTADLLAREVLQNSWDAAQRHTDREAPPFRFRFRFASLRGKAKAQFLAEADLDSLAERRGKIGVDRDIPKPEAVEKLFDAKESLAILYLEDYGTHGMFGDPAKITQSHLYKALYVLGSTGKDLASGTQGGSFGFGKSAFISTSEVRTAIAHTRFAQTKTDKATERLIGFTWWGEHEAGGKPFEGRAMFGDPAREQRLGAHPLTDKAAEKLAGLLGMPVRGPAAASLGSTVLLISPLVDPAQLKDAVERYWWPALEDPAMDVVIETSDGEEILPRPRLNKQLRPFLLAYGIASGLKQPKHPREERLASVKWRADSEGTKYGNLALVIDKEYTQSQGDAEAGLGDMTTPTVALVRGPRMVIEYKSFSSRLPIRGVYVADPEIDANLREVEPPSHNSWDNTSSAEISERSREIALGVMRRIRRSVKDFAQEFAPPPSAVLTDLPLFGDLLSQFFSGRVPGPNPGPSPSPEARSGAALTFRTTKPDVRRHAAQERISLTRQVGIRIPADARWEGASLSVEIQGSIAWDLTGHASGPLHL